MKEELTDAMNSMYQIENSLVLSKLTLNDKHKHVTQEKSVKMYFYESEEVIKTMKFSLTEAVL